MYNKAMTQECESKSGYRTVSVIGIGFAPKKTEHLVLPPDVKSEKDLKKFLKKSIIKKVGESALEALDQADDEE